MLAPIENLNTDTRAAVSSPTIVQSSDVINPVNDLNLSFNNTGNVLSVETVSIARNICQNIERKISAGEYVDLESLLNTPQNNTGANQALAINQEQLVLQPKQKTKNTTIGMGTDAFLIYTCNNIRHFNENLRHVIFII